MHSAFDGTGNARKMGNAVALMLLGIVATLAPVCAADRATLTVPVLGVTPSINGDDGWGDAAQTTIGWDFTNHRAAVEPANVAIAAAGKSLYVRFTVHQREAITASQAVDSVGENSDDDVTVRLWPSGINGIAYDFRSTPRGTRYQASSENANYAPAWTSLAHRTHDGYVVTMVIPLGAMRSDGHPVWRAQFERDIKIGNERDEWAHADAQSTSDQAMYAGTLEGMSVLAKSAHTEPRAGIYALAQAGAPRAGGSTSRVGADLAIPITPTTSIVATIHPDFSNVETDQQSIAPTTFARYYNEVRPFFAQGAQYYDNSSCYGCSGWSELYTPSIPTPRDGYQLEGKNGPFTFGALDAVGAGRIDDAQSVSWQNPANTFSLSTTRVASQQTTLSDVVNFGSLQFTTQHGLVGYFETGAETGTTVTRPGHARRWDGGIAYQTKDDFDAFTMRSVGSQWNPADGFTSVNDIAGYSAQLNRTFHLHGALRTIALFEYEDHYTGSDGFGTNLLDTESQATFTFANNVSAQANIGTGFYRVPGDPTLHPANLQGARIDDVINTPQQSTFNYQAGHFGDGWLTAIDRIAGLRIARRATLSLEGYSTTWNGDGLRDVQWLDRANLIFDVSHNTSVTIGLRKLIGTPPPFPGQFALPYVNATNVTFSFSRRRAQRRSLRRLRRSEHALDDARADPQVRPLLRRRSRHLSEPAPTEMRRARAAASRRTRHAKPRRSRSHSARVR